MTWIIGKPGPLGYAIGISDIRVTLNNGVEIDCLQKIYQISEMMAIGFAGSVLIGFEIVAQLIESLSKLDSSRIWDPIKIAKDLPLPTQKLYNSFPADEKDLGCEIILLTVHPHENDGDAPWPKCYVYSFSWPYFNPVIAQPAEIISIGVGKRIGPYKDALRNIERDNKLFEFENMQNKGYGFGLLMAITSVITKFPVEGISDHLHLCVVGRDGVFLGKNNVEVPDDPKENFVMPDVARSMDELENIITKVNNGSLKLARC